MKVKIFSEGPPVLAHLCRVSGLYFCIDHEPFPCYGAIPNFVITLALAFKGATSFGDQPFEVWSKVSHLHLPNGLFGPFSQKMEWDLSNIFVVKHPVCLEQFWNYDL